MFELGSIGGNKLDAAVALRQPLPEPRPKSHTNAVKNMIRLLRRSHSTSHANSPLEKYFIGTGQNQKINHHHQHPHQNHVDYNNKLNLIEESRVVNCVEGLPFVMRNKKKGVS